MNDSRPAVGLLVTCLVDLFRPSVAEAAVRLLEQAGFRVLVPAQTCCGQPNFNSGDQEGARSMARRMICAFENCERVVAPSASCIAMLKEYPRLFPEASADHARALALAMRAMELTAFLRLQPPAPAQSQAGTPVVPLRAAYQDSCSALRQLGVRDQPRALLSRVDGLQLIELAGAEECCGFGGLFCARYPDVSVHIADQKIEDIQASGAQCLIGGETGCLLHLEGRMQRRGLTMKVAHVAEVLAGCWPGDADDYAGS